MADLNCQVANRNTNGAYYCTLEPGHDGPCAAVPYGPLPLPEPIMQYFAFEHLPERLQKVSKPFCELAQEMVRTLPRNAERSAGLRKLLEAKDCAVRALIAVSE